MNHRSAHVAIAATWMACFAPSCTGTDVTLATLPATQEAGVSFDAGTPFETGTPVDGGTPFGCATSDDCLGGSYCEKPTCNGNARSGTCRFFPVNCPPDENLVCGCNGITYFNDCLRQLHAVAASSPGECQPEGASRCSASVACPADAGAICALFGVGPATCSANAEGSCWVLPLQCPSQDPNEWDSCPPGALHCVDTCTALGHGGSFIRSSSCHGRDD
jgi:hypothetical protein